MLTRVYSPFQLEYQMANLRSFTFCLKQISENFLYWDVFVITALNFYWKISLFCPHYRKVVLLDIEFQAHSHFPSAPRRHCYISCSSGPHLCCWEVSHEFNYQYSPVGLSQVIFLLSNFHDLFFLWCLDFCNIPSCDFLNLSWHSLGFQKKACFPQFWKHRSHCLFEYYLFPVLLFYPRTLIRHN